MLFTLKITTNENELNIPYTSIEECMDDIGLRVLFDEGHVNHCSIWTNQQRITAREITKWDTLLSQLTSNSSTILRNRKSQNG